MDEQAPDPGGMAGHRAGPLLSVVLPVNGVEAYLAECLDSVLGQQGAGLEVIAVDDASTDNCGAILDARAAADARLSVIHLAGSAGPGQARNLGAARATGEYVWFVDPDDLLAPGAIDAVSAALGQARPDVLLIDYLLLHADGRTEPSPGRALLADMGGRAITLADRPAFIERTMTSWSKVFRKEFLAGLGVPFPPGIHEDVPVCCAALLSAARIAVLDRVCYLYRQRERSFLATPSMGHFAVLASYEEVFALMDTWPAGRAPLTAAVRAAVFGRAMEHDTTVLASGLVPRHARREFFRRMAADFRRFRPPGYVRPPGMRGLKIRVVERNAYWLYCVLGPLNEARVGVRNAARRGRRAGRGLPVTSL